MVSLCLSDLHENWHTQVLAYKVSNFIKKIEKTSIFGAIMVFSNE